MPISRLPEATARELGSTLAISTPGAVVKELLDNALDAGATFVDIIVSSDTLGRIEVRDNGYGISTDDFDSLGRSGHTSKITTFDDVMAFGGRSLGFRGVALASINAVAEITLTSRTAKDPVATMLQFSPGGGVASRRHVSAPVGTTVHVAKLFFRTPVREKVALRDTKKSLVTIKELLQAYALARPRVKLYFRVIPGDKPIPWSYNPKPQGDMKDTIVQLFGTELASGCAERAFSADYESPTVNSKRSSLSFEAYLPHSFADVIRVSRRAFFSVDSRPVSTTRGTLKKLYDIFKTHLSRAMSSLGQTELPKSPFIRLNIQCEPRSYDPNIEPSKDDVLFHDESRVIKEFEQFMLSVYPIVPTSPLPQTEATLLTPSSTDPQQRNAPLGATELPREFRGARNKSGFSPINPGAACKRYPSPDGRRRLEHAECANISGPPAQAPSTSIASQLSSALALNQEGVREDTGFNGSPGSSGVSGMGSRRSPVEEDGLSGVSLPILQTELEKSRITRRASTPSVLSHAEVRGGNVNETACGTVSTETIRNSIEDIDQPSRPFMRLPFGPYPEHIQPTPSIRTRGAQSLSNLQAQPFVVDMSSCFVDSDDEDSVPRRPAPRPSSRLVGGDKDQTHTDIEREDPLDGLNPWSIAKLTASRRRPRQPLPQPLPQIEDQETASMGERVKQPLPTKAAPNQSRKCTSNFAGPSRKPPIKVPGGAYRKPTSGQPSSRRLKQPTVQTTLSCFRAPGHPGHAPVGSDEETRDLMSGPTCSQPAGSQGRPPREDPRSYLFGNEQAVRNDEQRRLRQCKTDLLPLEKTPAGYETHRLGLTVRVKTQDLARMIDMMFDVDDYSREGKIESGLYNIDNAKLQSLISRATAMMRE